MIAGSGTGWGKSELMVAILAAIVWPQMAPPCFASPIFQKFPHEKRSRIISTPKEIESIGSLQNAIKRYFPTDKYEFQKKGKFYPCEWTTDTGWIIDAMTYEQSESEFAGPNIGLTIFNEPPPKPIWDESLRRTRAGGIVLGAMTSLLQNPWVVDGIFNRANGQDVRVIFGDVEENCLQHGKNGHLDHKAIEQALSTLDPDEREASRSGKPLSMSGRILKTFNRQVHIAPTIERPENEISRYMVVDPAIGKPVFSIWATVDGTGALHIYDEYPDFEFEGAKDSNLGVDDFSKIFLAREAGKEVHVRILDRHFGNNRRTMGGLTLRQEFAQEGIFFQDSYQVGDISVEVETGILKIKDYLRYDASRPIDNLNRPKLTIDPKCVNTIAAIERWARDPKTGKPQEKYKDPVDCVRYLVESNPEVQTVREWGERRVAQYGVNNA